MQQTTSLGCLLVIFLTAGCEGDAMDSSSPAGPDADSGAGPAMDAASVRSDDGASVSADGAASPEQSDCEPLPDPPGDHVVDLGAKGLSPGDRIDGYIADYFEDGNEVHIPAGRYQWGGGGFGAYYANASLVGDGEVELETGGGHTWDLLIGAKGDVELRNLTIRGRRGDEGKIRLNTNDADAVLTLRNVNQPDGSADGRAVGYYVHGVHRGSIYFYDCHVEGFGNNGIYASDPGRIDKNDGAVHVIRGLYRNNNIANVRLGSSESSAVDVTVVTDERPPENGLGHYNPIGLKIREGGSNVRVEGVHITQMYSAQAALFVAPREDRGSGFIRDVRISNSTEDPAIRVNRGEWSGTNIHTTGPGSHAITGGSFTELCEGEGCDEPRATPIARCSDGR